MITWTKEQAKAYMVNYQMINTQNPLRKQDLRLLFDRIHSIQVDPLDVVGRNQDLVLQARLSDYQKDDIDTFRYVDKILMDGWDKMMAIHLVDDFNRFYYIRQSRTKEHINTLQHRLQLDALTITNDVLDLIREEGPKYSKDISIGGTKKHQWGSTKLSSAALEYLFFVGELSVSNRKNAQKEYDLTERVYPHLHPDDNAFNDTEEFALYYLQRRIESMGLVTNKSGVHFSGLHIHKKSLRTKLLQQLVQRKTITQVTIQGIDEDCFVPTKGLEIDVLIADKVTFVAPLDNLIWDRDLIENLFGFYYRWEVYTPKNKRQYGYYVLPILYQSEFVGRIEFEKHTKLNSLKVKNIWIETTCFDHQLMKRKIDEELIRFEQYIQKK